MMDLENQRWPIGWVDAPGVQPGADGRLITVTRGRRAVANACH